MTTITLADVLVERDMNIKVELPPNIDAIDKIFPGVKNNCSRRGILFAYGNTIFNPSGIKIPAELIAHELTHSIQQDRMGANGVEEWWAAYLADKNFRFAMELEAHRIEYQEYAKQGFGRAFRRRYLAGCAERLAGPLYGKLVKKAEAKKLIATTED